MTTIPSTHGNPGLTFYAAAQGQLYELTHVCDTEQEALDVISKTPNVSAIATDAGGRVYLAKDNGRDFRIV